MKADDIVAIKRDGELVLHKRCLLDSNEHAVFSGASDASDLARAYGITPVALKDLPIAARCDRCSKPADPLPED
jgi:hypothetical protein